MLKVKFEMEKETKNTVRFAEVEEEGYAKVGTIYIPKSTLAQNGIDKEKGFTMEIKAVK
ncbi:hypothetical protein SAMN05446037_1006144 [Anaerovirgula multivorans]|uniref:Uncharacterized protein n=1 Tax=Anaerovirgula multivorans TaxID=312168 RepID=A0A239CT96_9FIRM|nr:hypothetical protein [Anaerovirgula multivorans]SNS23425.1 hypothetical protein SAMN05446037_1006144 [Anaerovirgula multivorans]